MGSSHQTEVKAPYLNSSQKKTHSIE